MENNLENKAKFFAQYLGQNVLTRPHCGAKKWILGEEVSIHSVLSKQGYDYQYFLELKPVSLITDEELVKIAKFYESTAHNVKLEGGQILFDFIYGDQGASGAIEISDGYCLDWLRNNGFATEWMGLSVENLVNFGWIKLKEN